MESLFKVLAAKFSDTETVQNKLIFQRLVLKCRQNHSSEYVVFKRGGVIKITIRVEFKHKSMQR